MIANAELLVSLMSGLVVDVILTRHWPEAASGTVHGCAPSLAVLEMMFVHAAPLLVLYSILTFAPGLPPLVHVML